MKKLLFLNCLVLFLVSSVFSQEPQYLRQLSLEKTPDGLNELKAFLSIPNDALIKENIERNVVWLEAAFKDRGFETQVLPTSNTPLFFAERDFEGASKTVLFYMHFDGQGVVPGKWFQDSPYEPVLKKLDGDNFTEMPWENINSKPDPDWRIFARSASDDKGPIIMFLQAIDILDNNLSGDSKINIKVILDGEEEKGSAQLPPAVIRYSELLAADYMIINDGPIHLSERPTIVFGGRGITAIKLTAFGPRTAQHSGHYGNYAPNPAFRLASILTSMKDKEGRVIIPGYYDGIDIKTSEIQKVLMSVPDDLEAIHRSVGITTPEKVGDYYQEALQYPSLNVRGMQSGWVGDQVRTIVPAIAEAEIDIRLVPESDPERLKSLVREHIVKQGYYVIDRDPTEEERLNYSQILKFESTRTTLPFRTDVNSEIGEWLKASIETGMGAEPVIIRIMGGTVPIAPFINALEIPAVIIPLVNPDNNQHGPNENLRIWNFTNGIQVFLSIMTQ